jgi:polyhydroxybutyrate depolymerase
MGRMMVGIAVLGGLVISCAAGETFAPQARSMGRMSQNPSDQKKTVEAAGTTRTYLLHVPATLPEGKRLALVLVFHGGGGHAWRMPRFTGFDRLADEQGFIVAYPESLNRHWNDGRGLSPADDVAFIRTLIAETSRSYPVDAKRIYSAGISNGGFFAQKLACELADQMAAVASVAATMPEPLVATCEPSRPVSVLFMHGTEDRLVHVEGGNIARRNGRSISLADAAKYWRDRDQTTTFASEELPDRVRDGTHVRCETYGGGKEGTEVVVYTIEGGGHAWPGGPQYLPVFLVGRASHNLDATRTIWEFFQRHSVP